MRYALAALFVFGAEVPDVQAKETVLDAAPFEGKKVRLDGMLREWPRLTKLSEHVSGPSSADEAEGAVAYDETHLFVAMRVRDGSLVRTRSLGAQEDYGQLVVAFPTGSGHKSYELKLYPGDPGKVAGAVQLSGLGKVPGAQLVEAPASGGYTFEAKIPWSVFPEAKRVRSGLRGALKFHDADPGGKVRVTATSKSHGSNLPPLTIEAEYALHESLVLPKGLSPKPGKELFGDLVGDGMWEHVAIYDRYLAVTGWNYRKGTEFYYQDLRLRSPGDLHLLSLEDVNGDGHQDIVMRRRVGSSGDAKEYFEIWHFRASNDGPQLLFQHEVGLVQGAQRISNKAELSKKKGTWSVIVAQGTHDKIDVDTWNGPTISGDRSTLLPWETVQSRRYEWKGQAFELEEEKEGKPKLKGPQRGTKLWSGKAPDPLDSSSGSGEETAPAPRPPTSEELLDQVYRLYKKDRGVRGGTPRFDFVTNVAGNEKLERVLVHGLDIVVFGSGFKGGTSYVYTTIGVKEGENVLDVTARDVTGDGRAEVIVRGIIPVQASKNLGGDIVSRHALFIYRVTEGGISRIFAAETGRSLDGNSILARVAFVPRGAGLGIELRPGRAIGWTEKTYPFPEDKLPYGGLEPLLLPWSTLAPRAYSYSGTEFRLVP